ncbi:hypothetical protein EV121DRAFT_292580 [Schizophyllum commune]
MSTQRNMDALPIVNYRLIDFDSGLYRRQIEHFEYYWGIERGEIDLSSPLNHVQLRSDMAERMNKSEWALVPSKRIIDIIHALSEYNKAADPHKRKRFTEELPEQEYEYEFVPLHIATRDRPSMYLKRGSTIRTINKAYSKMPRIRSHAHPLFVVFRADRLILTGYPSLSKVKLDRLTQMTSAVLYHWLRSPPVEFLVGPDVWAEHRHPSSDDGSVARARLGTCNPDKAKRPARSRRKATRAPSPAPKSRENRPSIYDYARHPPPRPKSPALPRSTRASESGSSTSSDAGTSFSAADLRVWLSSISPSKTRRAPPPSSGRDAGLSRYRKEPARAPADALRVSMFYVFGGLVVGGDDGNNRAVYSSNDWARHNYRTCLWSSSPPEQAKMGYIDLIP